MSPARCLARAMPCRHVRDFVSHNARQFGFVSAFRIRPEFDEEEAAGSANAFTSDPRSP